MGSFIRKILLLLIFYFINNSLIFHVIRRILRFLFAKFRDNACSSNISSLVFSMLTIYDYVNIRVKFTIVINVLNIGMNFIINSEASLRP